jgi:hypothetical protein
MNFIDCLELLSYPSLFVEVTGVFVSCFQPEASRFLFLIALLLSIGFDSISFGGGPPVVDFFELSHVLPFPSQCFSSYFWASWHLIIVFFWVFSEDLSATLSLLYFSSQTKKVDPITFSFQILVTKSWNPSYCSQAGLNLNGIGPRFFSCETSNKIGL